MFVVLEKYCSVFLKNSFGLKETQRFCVADQSSASDQRHQRVFESYQIEI
jgi:hypothetical protein